ncbi:hypothetical protein BC792_10655 [Sphingobacterium allocomposti]|uniref:Avirulence protein n=1 Tax=Sphingobacterium allocomposti TaxID=415956 RepID=A0A5S5DKA3_9SPHI|nr:DUF6055 domain-containing protein [Sphingobacterium composti Yoo et al. 2007 non Ten et al. 2007]TYP96347.1 hypothetical protein BC792_10655 [Sphingobacterium composti Yoo et al. 2007 non Ten et al. 2007]HLS94063.1 DUF6055 domain-containing protein [Sphingobacterium sp.]
MKKKIFYISLTVFVATMILSCKDTEIDEIAYDISNLQRPVPIGNGTGDQKQLYLPTSGIWDVPANNDFNDYNSKYSLSRRFESANLALLWDREFGSDLAATTGANVANVLGALEGFYDYYANQLKFVDVGNSLTDKYKMVCFVRGGTDGTAYGGGAADSVGMLWMPASRLGAPYTTLAHELGHAFQYMVHADGNWGFSNNPVGGIGQSIFEVTSQFMTMMLYPDLMTIENWHLVEFMNNTHLAFLHENMRYSSHQVLTYWTDKYGLDMVGKVWRQAVRPEDPVATYKRIQGMNQEQFNDEMFDAHRRFITWDIPLIRIGERRKYANQHFTTLYDVGEGWYRITPAKCPQNYGYNGIRLNVPPANTTVHLDFKGLAGAAGYRSIKTDKAGWRYGFVAYKSDESRVYSDTFSASEGTASFVVPENTTYLWLVVSGAPTEHWEHIWDDKDETDEQWPYQIKLTGTSLSPAMIE